VGLCDVCFGDGEIDFDHFESRVTEDLAQGVDISAIAQEHHGKGMAKAVGMSISDAGQLAEGVNELVEGIAGERNVMFAEEDMSFGGLVIAFGQNVFH